MHTIELEVSTWRQTLPEGLRHARLTHFEAEGNTRAEERRIRAILDTRSALGRLLVDEFPGRRNGPQRFIYSADHLVATSRSAALLNQGRRRMARTRASIRAPHSTAQFLYIDIHAPTPNAIDRERDRWARIVGPQVTIELDGVGQAGGAPNDPDYDQQWHHRRADAELAWDITQGARNVRVAVLDTGLNLKLAEFKNRIARGAWDFVNDDDDPSDDHGHGTAVTGVIAANANNGILGAGVDWRCQLIPIKVLDERNLGLYSWWAQGIHQAIENHADVINLSAGGSGLSQTLTNAIDEAIAAGAIFVTITQNDGRDSVSFPGNLPQCITVGATDRDDTKTSFSNWGPEIDLVAPGRDIGTVSRSGNLTQWWGTSFAAPQVAGAAALIRSVRPAIDQNTMRAVLTSGAEDRVGDDTDTPGFDAHHGWGRLNIYNSLLLAQSEPRIARTPDGLIHLSWRAPPNATSRRPYAIRWSDDLIQWQTIANPKLRLRDYAEWIDNGRETGRLPTDDARRFYQLLIAPEVAP